MTPTLTGASVSDAHQPNVDLSIVMPCLNESDTIGSCITKAKAALATLDVASEIVIADNGSTDGSREIARELGARVVPVTERGYGSALMGGIAAARGRWIIMGDADDSYDFGEVPKFVPRLTEGFELVQGCRLPSGGGRILPGAMPPLHRWWGNPMFSAIARRWFRVPIHDIYCGMRGFSKDLYQRIDLQCTGMEFATEMVIKAALFNASIAEVPITLHPDGRKKHAPHLRTFRDGWRTLRFFLLCTPRWLYLVPGVMLILAGLLGYAVAMPGLRIRGVHFDVHTLLFASLSFIVGFQAVAFGVLARMFATTNRLLPKDPTLERLYGYVDLERGLLAGATLLAVGAALLAAAVIKWWETGFGPLDYPQTMRWVIPGATAVTIGCQTVFASFFASMLGLQRR